jgi:hypothetical protein
LRVISGVAWVTIDGEGIILPGDKEMTLKPRKSRAVITAVGENFLVYEVR